MTPKISLIAAAGIATLTLTASAAFAQPQPGLSDFEPSASIPLTVRDTTTEGSFAGVSPAKLALESNLPLESNVSTYAACAGRGACAPRDTFERAAAPTGTAHVATVSSGSGIEWPQVGVGFVVGILLALLGLALRHMRVRPLAH